MINTAFNVGINAFVSSFKLLIVDGRILNSLIL